MIQQRNRLEEVDGSTFARLYHWAYAGFYRAAEAFIVYKTWHWLDRVVCQIYLQVVPIGSHFS